MSDNNLCTLFLVLPIKIEEEKEKKRVYQPVIECIKSREPNGKQISKKYLFWYCTKRGTLKRRKWGRGKRPMEGGSVQNSI